MALRLQVVSRHKQSLRERSSKEFGQNGGTIGRSLESDWVLPDGQRFLVNSRRGDSLSSSIAILQNWSALTPASLLNVACVLSALSTDPPS